MNNEHQVDFLWVKTSYVLKQPNVVYMKRSFELVCKLFFFADMLVNKKYIYNYVFIKIILNEMIWRQVVMIIIHCQYIVVILEHSVLISPWLNHNFF